MDGPPPHRIDRPQSGAACMLGAARPVRRFGGSVPVFMPPAESGTTAGMRVVVTRAG